MILLNNKNYNKKCHDRSLQTVKTTQKTAMNLGTKTIILPEGALSISRLHVRIESMLDWTTIRDIAKG
jgi:hypothetical protein